VTLSPRAVWITAAAAAFALVALVEVLASLV